MMRHNTAKWLGSLLVLVVLAAGCGVLHQNAAARKAEASRVAALVRQQLDARKFEVEIEYMSPLRGPGRSVVGSSYSLTVDGDTINSHLPYQGTAYSVPYGGGKVLNFEDEIDSYTVVPDKADRRTVEIKTDNDEDVIVFRLTVFDSGKADLQVRCQNREAISYSGQLKLETVR